jgi:aminoglycoside phosphotransferase (APT) family kinase protein
VVAADAWRIVDAATSAREAEEEPVIRPVHGDLYEAQVFVARDFSLGLIDLDDLGPGDPAGDAANFCAHLIALALSVPAAAPRLLAYRELVRDAFLTRLGIAPAALAWREAVAMLLLATGPFRVLDPRWPREVGRRVRLAVRLLETAEERRCRTSS